MPYGGVKGIKTLGNFRTWAKQFFSSWMSLKMWLFDGAL